jgi:hypothetical protein
MFAFCSHAIRICGIIVQMMSVPLAWCIWVTRTWEELVPESRWVPARTRRKLRTEHNGS